MSFTMTADDMAKELVEIFEQFPDDMPARARDFLDTRGFPRRRDIALALCATPGLYKLPQGREQLFALAPDLHVDEMELVESMATESILWGNDGIPRGWDNIQWLVKHKQLASRKDLCLSQDKGVLDLLVEAWGHNALLHTEYSEPEHQRVWVADLVQWLVQQGPIDEQTQSVALRRAAIQCQAGHNLGLILGLLDAGAPWQTWLEDAPIQDNTRAQIDNHPGVRKWRLEQVAQNPQEIHAGGPAKRKI